jgi:hypothetical protein
MKRRLLAAALTCLFAVSVLAGGPESPPAPDPGVTTSSAVVDVLLALLIASLPK